MDTRCSWLGTIASSPTYMGTSEKTHQGQQFWVPPWPYPPSRASRFSLPSGKRLHSYGKSPLLMGKSTISTGSFFNSYFDITRGYVFFSLNHPPVVQSGAP